MLLLLNGKNNHFFHYLFKSYNVARIMFDGFNEFDYGLWFPWAEWYTNRDTNPIQNNDKDKHSNKKSDKKSKGTYQPRRSRSGLYIVKNIIKLSVYTKLVNIERLHIDMPNETKEFLNKKMSNGQSDVIYTSLHKSLWETIGIPYVLDKEGFPIPYMVMGNNLVKGSIFVKPLTKLGVIVSERENSKKMRKDNTTKYITTNKDISTKVDEIDPSSLETLEQRIISNQQSTQEIINVEEQKTKILTSSEKLIEKISYALSGNNPVVVFPVDGRSKDGLTKNFKTTATQAAINLDEPIVPISVDYFELNEESDFVEYAGKPYTFRMDHIFRWTFKNLGIISVTFGKPIIPSQVSTDRKELSRYVREQCLDLVKIYARNVVAYSMMQEDVKNNPNLLSDKIKYTLDKLSMQSNKFIDFTLNDTIDELIVKAELEKKDPRAIKIYGNNILHYIEGMYDK